MAFLLVLLGPDYPAPFRPALEANGPIVVNMLSDASASGDGLCSLRGAINNANAEADTTSGDRMVGTGGDTIDLSVSVTVTLGSTFPNIQKTLTVDVSGQTVTIDGVNSFQVLVVKSDTISFSATSEGIL